MAGSNNLFKVPKSFTAHKGRASFDMPQALFRESDHCQIEVFKRNGQIETMTLYEVDWASTYLPDDIIAWRRCE